MQHLHPRALVHGTLGGIAAGAVVALWFLVLDLAAGEAFRTPTLLARTILGDETAVTNARLVASYTLLHFGVFALLGMATAWFVSALGGSPGLVMGAVFGLGVLTMVHYGALLVTSANVLTVLPAPHVLAANLLGGMVMMMYLHYALHAQTPLGLGVLREHHMLANGLITGLIGAGVVAVWFLLLDTLTQTPFYTPAALGSVVFLGAASPSEVQVNLGVVAAYTVLHVVAFALVGIAIVWSAERLEQVPSLWLMGLLAFIMLEALFLGTVGSLSQWVLGAVGLTAIGIGNLIAVAAMGKWVWSTHPHLREELLEKPVNTRI